MLFGRLCFYYLHTTKYQYWPSLAKAWPSAYKVQGDVWGIMLCVKEHIGGQKVTNLTSYSKSFIPLYSFAYFLQIIRFILFYIIWRGISEVMLLHWPHIHFFFFRVLSFIYPWISFIVYMHAILLPPSVDCSCLVNYLVTLLLVLHKKHPVNSVKWLNITKGIHPKPWQIRQNSVNSNCPVHAGVGNWLNLWLSISCVHTDLPPTRHVLFHSHHTEMNVDE